MPHLPAERLAALADDAPLHATPPRDDARGVVPIDPITAEEAEHLAACVECARERDAYRVLLAVAADERARLAPPLTSWGAISAQLREEGLLAGITGDGARDEPAIPALAFALTGPQPLGRRRASFAGRRWGRRAAAAALFVVGGAIAGRASAGLPPLGLFGIGSVAARDSVRVAMAAAGNAAAAGGATDAAATTAAAAASLVADTMVAFRSTTDALVALAKAEHEYQVAAAYLLAHDSSTGSAGAARLASSGDSSGIYRARLAALDNVMAATREALYEAPHDPVINRYYLATVGAREATLQQLNTALPAGARLTRF